MSLYANHRGLLRSSSRPPAATPSMPLDCAARQVGRIAGMRKLFLDDSLKVLMVLTNLEGGKDSEMKGIEPTLGVDIPSEDAETLEQLVFCNI